jgi:ATP-binding cassette subfamily C protein
MRFSAIAALRLAFWEFCIFSPVQVSLCLLLMLLRGLTSGAGLFMLVPLLHLAGFNLAGGVGDGFTQLIGGLYASTGMPLSLSVVLITYVGIISFIALLGYALTVMTAGLQQGYICMLRDRLFRALLRARWQFIIERRMSDFTHSLSGQVQTVGHSSHQMLDLLGRIILTMVYVLLSLLVSWRMSLLAVGCALLLFLILTPLNKYIYQSGNTQLLGYKTVFHILTEQLAGLKMIKSYSAESHYADGLLKAGRTLERQNVRMARFNALTRMIYLAGAAGSFSLLFYFAVERLKMPPADLLLLLLIFSRLLPQVSALHTGLQRLLHQLPDFTDVRAMLEDCLNAAETAPDFAVPHPRISRAIHIKQLGFSYPGRDTPVIDNLSLDILRDRTVAITGPSGAGKSTLADLIAGLLTPTTGCIYCDDVALRGEIRSAWRKNIAYITQEVYLFHDTVRNNLIWVREDVTERKMWEMLRLAAAENFVRKLPRGLDTLIGDRGVRLSGGERQRLALARALLSRPGLLILDEATSALDHENERKIHQALEHLRGRMTIIVIAHRKTTIEHADQLIELTI